MPTRAGILNVWRYYDEVFEFHEGRLLLRGPNGSGKSKALELLLPFLFDANLRAHRLSTFGTAERTMHWNMMGEGATGTTRVGYVWLEFGARDEPERWFTCGVRLQASTHTSTVHPDYFTTALRIGAESDSTAADFLALTTEGRPLTRPALEARLGARGRVHDNAGDYREALRTTLFAGLSEQRYDALITALLQLRTPKLSQRLDPGLLSTLLSKALPPLGQDEIADLAEGFERLDAQRERLARLEREVDVTRGLARQQRAYARRVLRANAAALLSATSELEKLSATAKQSAEEFERVERGIGDRQATIESLENEHTEQEARRDGLMESEAYKQGAQLNLLRQSTESARYRAAELRVNAQASRDTANADAESHRKAGDTAERQRHTVELGATETAQAAGRAGMTGIYQELAAAPDSDQARPLLRGAVRARSSEVAIVREALGEHDNAIALRQKAEEDLESARKAYMTVAERREAARAARESAVEQLREQLRDWASRCTLLTFDDPEAVAERAESEPAVLELVNEVSNAALREINREELRCEADTEFERTRRAELTEEQDRLLNAEDLVPDPPPWRSADRSAMRGAPLWRLIDFAAGAAESDRAGIEAALQASGLLDAWIGDRGEVIGHDLFADPDALSPVPGASLADVLVPVSGIAVDEDSVRRLLSAVAYGQRLPESGAAAIGADGHWRIGNLTGSWSTTQASYVGALTRERARERRLAELAESIAECDRALAGLAERAEAVALRQANVAAEIAARPSHENADAAQFSLTAADSELQAADSVVRQRVDDVSARERSVRTALRELNSVAAETGLPADREALTRLGAALDAFADRADVWLDDRGRWRRLLDAAAELDERRARSEAGAAQQEQQATTAESEHRAYAAKLAEIESTIDADYRAVLDRLANVRSRIDELDALLKSERHTLLELTGRRERLAAQHTADVTARDAAVVQRDHLNQRFRHLATGTLAADSDIPDASAFRTILTDSEGVRAGRDAARLIAAAWPDLPHADHNVADAFTRLSASVHECRTTLAARADLDLETDGSVYILTAVVDGIRVGAAELLTILRTEADQANSEITTAEHDLFDRTLTGDTRRHLATRIRQANELVDGMNARLEQVRTASNVSVRLVWEVAPELPSGTRAARDLLLKDPSRHTEADRESLHRFLRDRVEVAKAADTATNWEEQLTQVFEYTAWHRFVVKVDRGKGDGWQVLTKKLHGALSGGEKAIALHLPLFAAVAAHYQVVPDAPRLILLDEVFVGVDTTNRGQIFALLTALDLDLVLTSDHEWCTYAELPGIGIHQLLSGDGDEAVTTARFTWDGKQLLPTG